MLTTCWRTDACRARWFTIYPSVFTCQSARRGNWKTTPCVKQWHEAPHAALRSNMSRCQGMPRWGRNPFPQLQETTLSFLKGYLATCLTAGCIRISWRILGNNNLIVTPFFFVFCLDADWWVPQPSKQTSSPWQNLCLRLRLKKKHKETILN